MATLDVTRNYADGEVLTAAELDAFLDDIETFLNVTQINDDNIQNSGITGSTKLLNQSVTEAKLASSAVTTAKIADVNVTTAKIADSNVTTAKIADSNVTTTKIADSNVTTAKIADSNVTTAKILDANVTTDKIADANVTTAKLASGAVTNAALAAGAVTPDKCSTNYVGDILSHSFSSVATVRTLGTTLTTTGRPVLIVLCTGQVSAVSGSQNHELLYVRDTGGSGTAVRTFFSSATAGFSFDFGAVTAASGVAFVDTPPAGTHSWGWQGTLSGASAGVMTLSTVTQLVFEL